MDGTPIEHTKSKFLPEWQWLSNPWVTFIGTVTGLIGLAALGYSWIFSPTPRQLIVTSDPPVTIVRGGQVSSVDVLYHGNKITTDVYARQVYIWNAGSESIRKENILEPIAIVIPHAVIVETRVKKVSRPLTNIETNIDGRDRVLLSWNILEHNDGAEIDVIYASPDAGKLEAVGVMEHQPQVRVREYENARSIVAQGWARTIILSLMGALAVLLLIFGLFLAREVVSPKDKLNIHGKVFGYLFTAMIAFMAVSVLWYVITSLQPDVMPPVF